MIERRKKIQYFVHYKFLPGFGFYGLGLDPYYWWIVAHSDIVTLRQLIDAGTLSNLTSGFQGPRPADQGRRRSFTAG